HQFRRGKQTDYATHLREKQKVKHYYGVLERQFRGYYDRASRSKGNTGSTLMSLLERRLDNIVHRLGFGSSRAQARQLVAHGHVTRVKNRAKSLQFVQSNLSENRREVPDFLALVEGGIPEGRVMRLPEAEDISIPVQTQLIIELCSK